MMPSTLAFADLARLLAAGANQVKQNHELLSKLDSATGDGDHGTTMKRTADAMIESVRDCEPKAIQPLLASLGWNVMSVDGGSTSPLLGSFFMGMSEAADILRQFPEWPRAQVAQVVSENQAVAILLQRAFGDVRAPQLLAPNS